MGIIASNPKLIPFLATLTGAAIGAIVSIIAQMISHRYSVVRENQKYNREVFQTLFAELYHDLLKTVIEFELAKPRIKKYDSNATIYQKFTMINNMNKIIETIKKNPKYVDPALLYFCYQYELTEELSSNKEDFVETMNKQIILNLLIYLYKVHKHGGIINTAFKRQLKQLILFLFWEFTKEDLQLPFHKKLLSLYQYYKWRIKL